MKLGIATGAAKGPGNRQRSLHPVLGRNTCISDERRNAPSHPMPPAPFAWRHRGLLAERNSERALIGEADAARNEGEAQCGIAQQRLGHVDTLAAQPAMRRNPHRLLEGEYKMPDR